MQEYIIVYTLDNCLLEMAKIKGAQLKKLQEFIIILFLTKFHIL